MTATTPLTVATRHADTTYSRFDRHRDRNQLRRTIIELHTLGHSTREISERTAIKPEQVRNIIAGRINPTHKPHPVNPPDMSEQHCRQLERTADAAINLACRLRDEDPQIVWDALRHMNRGDLQELAVVLLAALPVDKPKHHIFGWVYQLAVKL